MKSRTILTSLATLALTTLLFSSCAGYKLGSIKPAEYANINTLWIPTFENETLEPRLAAMVTNAVITQIQQDGTYKVGTKASSDAVLKGSVRRIRRQQQRSADNNILRTRELMVELQVNFEIEDLLTGQKIKRKNPYGIDKNERDFATGQRRSNGQVTGRTTIFLDPNFQTSEREGMPLAAEDAAEQLVSAITEGWSDTVDENAPLEGQDEAAVGPEVAGVE